MKSRAFFYIIVACLFWGTSGIFVHYLAPYGVTSIQMAAIRGTISLIVIGLYALVADRKLFKIKLKDLPLYIGAGLTMFLTGSCYFQSMQLTSVSTSVMLMYTAPLFVIWYSVLFLKEKLTPLKMCAVISMFVGCGLVSGIIGGMKYDALGLLIGLMSGISYGAYNIITKIQMCKKINPITATVYCYVFMAAAALLVSSPWEIVEIASERSIYLPLLMVGLGVFTTALPYFLYTLGLKHLPAGVVSSLGIIEPLAATLYSVALFGEVLNVYNIIGIVLVAGAVVALGKTTE